MSSNDVAVTTAQPAVMPGFPTEVPVSTGQEVILAPKTGKIVLSVTEQEAVSKAVSQMNFATMPHGDIIRVGFEAERNLHGTLDGFLALVNRDTAPKVFDLFDRLQKGVKDADLPKVLEMVKNGKPSLWDKFLVMIRRKNAQQILREFYERTRNVLHGRSKTLSDEVHSLEKLLADEMAKLFEELKTLESLKVQYLKHFGEFAIAAAVGQALLEKARVYVAEQTAIAAGNPGDVVMQSRVQDLQAKLQLLESRALALEGTWTRLPADQQVIRQILEVGVLTLQETTTTASSRFASIKMTLLALCGAFAVKGVQDLDSQFAVLDSQLASTRGQIVKEVAAAAASAPGNNRLEQVAAIEHIIAQTKEIKEIVKAAREANSAKFAEVRTRLEQARTALAIAS